jgi:hypothetical protein
MKRPLLSVLVAALSFGAGVLVTHTYHARRESRATARHDLVLAVDHVSSAHVTLALLEKQRTDLLRQLSERYVREGIATAYSTLSRGASLKTEAVPHLAESFRRATVSLRDSGAPSEVIQQAEAVLAQLPATGRAPR